MPCCARSVQVRLQENPLAFLPQQITPTLITFHQGGNRFMAMISTGQNESVDRSDFYLRQNREHWFQFNGQSLSPWSQNQNIDIHFEKQSIDEFLDEHGQDLTLLAITQSELQESDWNTPPQPQHSTVPALTCNTNYFKFASSITNGYSLYTAFLVQNGELKSILWRCNSDKLTGISIDADTVLTHTTTPVNDLLFFEDVYFPDVC